MRALTVKEFYRFHTQNLREIDGAMRHVARDLHRAIAQSQRRVSSAHARLFALLLGTWAECRLQKVLYEPGGFTDSDRALINGANTHFERWNQAIEVAFRRQYQISTGPLQPPKMPHTAYYRYRGIADALSVNLRPVIELRNKLAHGQWVYTLTNDGLNISVPDMRALRRENSLTLKLKHTLLGHLADAIRDLVVSRATFVRDFDEHFRALESVRVDLTTRKYAKYEMQIRDRYLRGRQRLHAARVQKGVS